VDFEWDRKKALDNIRKHQGITFEEASLTFFDEWAIEEFDDALSDESEKRFVLIGLAGQAFTGNVHRARKDQDHKRRKGSLV